MNWKVIHGNTLDVPADVLICSANVWLNLSGGVGGEILLRHGDPMQRELHAHLIRSKKRFADPGTVVQTAAHGLNFKAVLHAVAINVLYETSIALVRETVARSLQLAAALGAESVALTALATGYGRMPPADFGTACRQLLTANYPSISNVTICVRHVHERDEIKKALIDPSRPVG